MAVTTPNYDFTTMLEEAQLKLERQFSAMKILREHGQLILGSSSIVVSLFTLFKIASTQVQPRYAIWYLISIIVMAFLYGRLMYLCIKAVLPYPLEHAIDPTWETYATAFKDETDRTILERRVYAYLTAIKNNEHTIIKQYEISKRLNWNMALLVISIIVIAFLMPFMQVPAV